jgi:hypothetical protein
MIGWFCYGLYSSREPREYRYVGKTGNFNRPRGHLKEAGSGHACYKCNWIRQEQREGFVIEWVPLTWYDTEPQVFAAERRFIAAWKAQLTNATDGGEGTACSEEKKSKIRGSISAETRARFSLLYKGKKRPAYIGQRVREALTGTHFSEKRRLAHREALANPETRLKMSLAHRGSRRPMSEECKKKIGAANRGQVRTIAQRLAHSMRLRGRALSPQHRAKIAAGMARHFAAKP